MSRSSFVSLLKGGLVLQRGRAFGSLVAGNICNALIIATTISSACVWFECVFLSVLETLLRREVADVLVRLSQIGLQLVVSLEHVCRPIMLYPTPT